MSESTHNPKPLERQRDHILRLLTKEQLVVSTSRGLRTTARWQAAVMRSVQMLMSLPDFNDQNEHDLRIPFANTLHAIYGETVSEAQLTDMVLQMLQIETASLEAHQFPH